MSVLRGTAPGLTGTVRWCLAIAVCLLGWLSPAFAQGDETVTPTRPTPVVVSDEVVKRLEIGKLYMGKNNPAYALVAEKLSNEKRNQAGEQALRTFLTVVKLEPRYADGWLWLGIAYTERLEYEKDHPQGKPLRTDAAINDGLQAFHMAYLCAPTNEDCVKYYGDALMEYHHDFDAALKLWQDYLGVAETDLQKVVAYVQAARACLNKAYFGKEAKQPSEVIKQYYRDAENFTLEAKKLCPKARDVLEMQQLLLQYRRALTGAK